MATAPTLKLYRHPLSGHSHRAQLALSSLGVPHELVTVFGAKYNPEVVIGHANGLLKVMDTQLTNRAWLVGDRATLADIAGYSYIATAPEGNVDLGAYPNVRGWLARIEALPGFVPMQRTKVGLAA